MTENKIFMLWINEEEVMALIIEEEHLQFRTATDEQLSSAVERFHKMRTPGRDAHVYGQVRHHDGLLYRPFAVMAYEKRYILKVRLLKAAIKSRRKGR